MIQVIRHKISSIKHENIHQSTLDNPDSLDEYEINIIDLNNKYIWNNNENNNTSINNVKDLKNLSIMINDKKKAKIIIIFPQNLTMSYNKKYINRRQVTDYSIEKELKNMLPELKSIIKNNLLDIFDTYLFFENTKTKIANNELEASFHIKNNTHTLMNRKEPLTKSVGSEKWTTVLMENDIIITTLNLDTNEKIVDFLNELSLVERTVPIPEWIDKIKILDDEEEKAKIIKNNAKKKKLEQKIEVSNKILSDNNRYKAVLYETGVNLEKIVIDMLGEMIAKDLSDFTDLKREDFATNLEGVTLIGEIKGVKGSSKNAYISQLVSHMAIYKDENESVANIKGILIINHNLEMIPEERVPIDSSQIHLAAINNILIIESDLLLEMFNQYKTGEISEEKISTILLNKTGLLKL